MMALFSQRLRALASDTLDTSRRGGMRRSNAMMLVLTVMLTETVTGWVSHGAGEDEMLEACRLACRDIEPKVKKAMKARK
jgi:hypothetical protein